MVDINARIVQQLRQKTGVGMMDCKKALQATNGDVEAAVTWLRKKSIAFSSGNEKNNSRRNNFQLHSHGW